MKVKGFQYANNYEACVSHNDIKVFLYKEKYLNYGIMDEYKTNNYSPTIISLC